MNTPSIHSFHFSRWGNRIMFNWMAIVLISLCSARSSTQGMFIKSELFLEKDTIQINEPILIWMKHKNRSILPFKTVGVNRRINGWKIEIIHLGNRDTTTISSLRNIINTRASIERIQPFSSITDTLRLWQHYSFADAGEYKLVVCKTLNCSSNIYRSTIATDSKHLIVTNKKICQDSLWLDSIYRNNFHPLPNAVDCHKLSALDCPEAIPFQIQLVQLLLPHFQYNICLNQLLEVLKNHDGDARVIHLSLQILTQFEKNIMDHFDWRATNDYKRNSYVNQPFDADFHKISQSVSFAIQYLIRQDSRKIQDIIKHHNDLIDRYQLKEILDNY